MTRRWIYWTTRWTPLLFLALSLGATAARAQERCNYAIDIVVQSREQARPNADRAQLEKYSRLLERATSQCYGLGVAWFYRYLYGGELGNQRDADYFRRKAEGFNSEALRRREDPFAPPVMRVDPSIRISPYVREKWALVIGVGKFQDLDIRPLTYPAKDARDFAALLTDPNYGRFKPGNVTLLTDENATTVNIKDRIERLIGNAQAEDLVVVYLSSHGAPRESSKLGVSYVVTHDTKVNSLYATSLPMVSIVDDINNMVKAQRVVIFLDACYSGEATLASTLGGGREAGGANAPAANNAQVGGAKSLKPEGQGVSHELLNRFGQSVGRVIIAASQPNEVSWESDSLKNGIFTYYLIQAFKQNNGLSSIEEVFSYLRNQVAKRALEEKGQSQHPTMQSSEHQVKVDIRIGAAPQVR